MTRSTIVFSLLFSVLLSFSALAQNGDQIVLTVEDEQVTLSDFEAIFMKNNRDSVITQASLDEYMELFINFKLKVREAVEEGLDTNAAFQRELQGYRKQLSRPYLIDNELLDELVQEAFERKSQEVNASHILIKCDQNATPEDTLKAYNRIMELRKRIEGGEDFAAVATSKGGSEDPSVRENEGNLGWFTAFQMVFPFENAAYTTEVGKVSQPVRTRYGYHILKVHDKRDARGEIRVAHIMVRHKDKNDVQAKQEAENKAREIHKMLQEGSDFGELAMRFSQDASTSRNGGELPWFGTGKMVEEFEDAAFALKEDGQISEPVETTYGWHIIKRLEYRGVPDFASQESDIRKRVSRDSRAELTKQSFINKLKAEYGVNPITKSLKDIYKAADDDSAFVGSNGIKVKKMKKLSKELFSIDGNVYTAKDFYEHLNTSKIRRRDMTGREIVDSELNKYIERELMSYEDSQLERKYNDFRLLMNEYHDGILLFELTDRKVWSKAVKDTTGLEAFYEANKMNFMWEERVNGTIFTCADKKIAKSVRKMLKRGKTLVEIKDELNKTSSLNLSLEEGTWERSDKAELFAKAELVSGEIAEVEMNGQIVLIQVNELIAPTPKALNEARGMITAEYQNSLEQQWIEELRAKYSYQVNREVLYMIK
ncbi:peptidylprolyl isomerase [Sanyastnella coralliicola]|uniref:peptidylprolyl isomerase n=1 Tax=Sanyastnella coralliicola TaxID=3069118 RepID=UPI0027B99DDB|nr:peptidylprolyl isomerase [Longitalea sp. SCSIO 12813]